MSTVFEGAAGWRLEKITHKEGFDRINSIVLFRRGHPFSVYPLNGFGASSVEAPSVDILFLFPESSDSPNIYLGLSHSRSDAMTRLRVHLVESLTDPVTQRRQSGQINKLLPHHGYMLVHTRVHQQTKQIWPSVMANNIDKRLGVVNVSEVHICR